MLIIIYIISMSVSFNYVNLFCLIDSFRWVFDFCSTQWSINIIMMYNCLFPLWKLDALYFCCSINAHSYWFALHLLHICRIIFIIFSDAVIQSWLLFFFAYIKIHCFRVTCFAFGNTITHLLLYNCHYSLKVIPDFRKKLLYVAEWYVLYRETSKHYAESNSAYLLEPCNLTCWINGWINCWINS